MPGEGGLPSWLLPPILAVAAWTAIAPPALLDAPRGEAVGAFTVPAAVIAVLAGSDYVLWRARGRPWHDWAVIVPLLPAVGAAVWVAVGGLVLDLELTREELLGLEVGPGIALVGLLTTTISFHGRHHPDEGKPPPG